MEDAASEKDGTGMERTRSVHPRDEELRKSTQVEQEGLARWSEGREVGRKLARGEGRSWVRVSSTSDGRKITQELRKKKLENLP